MSDSVLLATTIHPVAPDSVRPSNLTHLPKDRREIRSTYPPVSVTSLKKTTRLDNFVTEPGRFSPRQSANSVVIAEGCTDRKPKEAVVVDQPFVEGDMRSFVAPDEAVSQTSRKRLSSEPPVQNEKRPKVERTEESHLSGRANKLATEELNLHLRARVLCNLGRSSQDEKVKIKKLSEERQNIRAQLLQQSCRGENNATHQDKNKSPISTLLPQESPLKNIISFARIEEEIVQTKIQYALAEKDLRQERLARGRATDATIQRIKARGKALAELYERRDATRNDRGMIDAFRRERLVSKPAIKQEQAENGDRSHSDRETLQSLVQTEDAEKRCELANTLSDKDERDSVPSVRQLRFALTDVETFIQP